MKEQLSKSYIQGRVGILLEDARRKTGIHYLTPLTFIFPQSEWGDTTHERIQQGLAAFLQHYRNSFHSQQVSFNPREVYEIIPKPDVDLNDPSQVFARPRWVIGESTFGLHPVDLIKEGAVHRLVSSTTGGHKLWLALSRPYIPYAGMSFRLDSDPPVKFYEPRNERDYLRERPKDEKVLFEGNQGRYSVVELTDLTSNEVMRLGDDMFITRSGNIYKVYTASRYSSPGVIAVYPVEDIKLQIRRRES